MYANNNNLGGRPPLYSDPDHLLRSIFAYLDWVSRSPLYDYKLTSKGSLIEVPKKRYPTNAACARFCGVAPRTWRSWKDEKHPLYDVVEFAESIIQQIKMEGVAVGLFRPNIVARDIIICTDDTVKVDLTINLIDIKSTECSKA